jgi:hypothetical protein
VRDVVISGNDLQSRPLLGGLQLERPPGLNERLFRPEALNDCCPLAPSAHVGEVHDLAHLILPAEFTST